MVREGGRLEPFNFQVPFPKPYIPRALTFEISGRIASDGKVAEKLDDDQVIRTIAKLKRQKVEAVAVCLLWSTVNSAHENRVGRLLKKHLRGVPYTLSHILNPVLREYRRASSAAIDASLKPMMSNYLRSLAARLQGAGFGGRLLMLTSKGGVMDFADLARAPIHAIGSGPSMAPLAGRYFAQTDTKADTAIVADTGGTTYDVSLVRRGTIPMTPETWIGQRYRGHIVGFPSVDVKSIGAGGGSVARVDEGGLLHVGPESAGAVPGPACYGRSGVQPTVTDASLVLGHIDPAYFLGGTMKLGIKLAESAIRSHVAKPLGMSVVQVAAAAIIRLATENMVSAIEEITIHQGVDPRGTVLIGGGGAAGLNSVAIARRLGCARVVIPETGAALSAAGALISDLHADYRAMFYTSSSAFDMNSANKVLGELTDRCKAFIKGPGGGARDSAIEYYAEAHYRSQIWEIDLPLRVAKFRTAADVARLREDFDKAHEEVFAYADPDSEVQFLGWRAVARRRLAGDGLGHLAQDAIYRKAALKSRKAHFEGKGNVVARVYEFAEMKSRPISGPAIIESPYTTVVIDPGAVARRAKSGSLVITP